MATDPILAARAATVQAIQDYVTERASKPDEMILLAGRDILTLLRDAANWRPRSLHDEPLKCAGVQVAYRPSLAVDEWKLMRLGAIADRKARE